VGETSVTTASEGADEGSGPPASQDGRLTRAARTRASVVEALLTLNEEGHLRPTARDIASRAGVSLRSLYVHFDDLEALFVAASHRQGERLGEMLPPMVTEGTFEQRLDAFLDRREHIHELGAGVRRAALLQEPFSPVLKQALAKGRAVLHNEVKACLAPELAAAGAADPAGRDRLLSALDIVTGSGAWESLRTHQNLSVDEAAARVRDMVLALIRSWVPADAITRGSATHPSPAAGPQG
jgi:AcrR family transcriptional regulator